MKKFTPLFIAASGLLLSAAFVSCDNEYDLSKDIDTDINVGKNFTIPVGQTVKINLGRIIEDGDLQTNGEGIYELHSNGEFNAHIADVDPFVINGLDPDFEDFNAGKLSSLPIPGDYNIPLDVLTQANYIPVETETAMPIEVKEMYLTEFNYGQGAQGEIKIRISNLAGINSVTFKDIDLVFPDLVTIQGSNAANAHEIRIPELTLDKSNNFEGKIPVNILRFEISENDQKTYFSDKYLDGNKDAEGRIIFRLDKKILLSAKTTVNVTPSQLPNEEFHIYFGYSISRTEVTKVNGVITPDVKIEEQLVLNDLPEFVTDKSSSFTPNDLKFTISLKNPIDMAFATSFTITPWNDETNSALGEPIVIPVSGKTAIKPLTTTGYVISNEPCEVPSGYINIVEPNIPNLLATIPDSYRIESGAITADGGEGSGFNLGENLAIEGNYDIEVPFNFKNFSINYTGEIDNLLSDLEDAAELTDKIILSMNAVSTIPVELIADIKLYDYYGNELKEINVTGTSRNKVTIKASPDGSTETTTPLTITLEEPQGSDQLEELEKIVYTIKAASPSSDGEYILKSSQYLILKDGVAKVPNGLTLEL